MLFLFSFLEDLGVYFLVKYTVISVRLPKLKFPQKYKTKEIKSYCSAVLTNIIFKMKYIFF